VPKAKRFVPWMLCHRVEDDGPLGHAAAALLGEGGADRPRQRRVRPLLPPLRLREARRRLWFHELFSPAFLFFLTERSPNGLAFEYVEGTLCVSLRGRLTLGEDLDALAAAAVELVRRIRAEIAERLGPATVARSAPGEAGFEPPSAGSTPQG